MPVLDQYSRPHIHINGSGRVAGSGRYILASLSTVSSRCCSCRIQGGSSERARASLSSRRKDLRTLSVKAIPRPKSTPSKSKGAPVPSAAPDADELAEAASAEAVAEDVETMSGAELEDELQELRARASAAEASLQAADQATQLQKDKFIRLNADWENYRKRTAAEQARIRSDVKGDVVKQLLPLVDSFELARGQLQPANDGEIKIDAAYQGVYKQMVDLMKAIGVTAVPGEGSPFDPAVHDAIMRERSEDVPDGSVLQVLRRGFVVEGKLLRAAMVKVSFSEAPAVPAPSGNGAAAADIDAFEDIVQADPAAQ